MTPQLEGMNIDINVQSPSPDPITRIDVKSHLEKPGVKAAQGISSNRTPMIINELTYESRQPSPLYSATHGQRNENSKGMAAKTNKGANKNSNHESKINGRY